LQAGLAEPGVQVPPLHTSFRVQTFWSSQSVSSCLGAGAGHPDAGLHAPTVWHVSAPVHVTAVPPLHTPAWHRFPVVQWSVRSVQDVLSAICVGAGHPDVGLHAPTVWHASAPVHVTAVPPVHAPAWHAFPVVQWSVGSVHVVLSAIGIGAGHPDVGLQAPTVWHASAPVHVTAVPPLHTPDWHVFPVVHWSEGSVQDGWSVLGEQVPTSPVRLQAEH
jgi:hypothetical protein